MIARHRCSVLKLVAAIASLIFVYRLLPVWDNTTTPDDYSYFASKTSYFLNANLDQSPISASGCTPVMFWLISRHGARSPDKKEILQMSERLPDIRDAIVAAGKLGKDVLDRLKQWKLKAKLEGQMFLSQSGEREQEEMGNRWRNRLMNLLQDRNKLLVRATDYQRTRESAKFFLKGVFKKELNLDPTNPNLIQVPPSPERDDDNLLRFMDNCPKYTKDVKENIETTAQVGVLEHCKGYSDMLENTRTKAGVNLSSRDIILIWQMCRFEKAWWPQESSPWCSIFTKESLQILEYKEDLKRYYTFAYGNDINWKMTQPLFSDILSKFEQVRASQSNLTGVLYFAHAETVGPLLAALGLYQDDKHLRGSDWPNDEYRWKSSHIIPFSANIGFVLMKCRTSPECLDAECEGEVEWKVMALHQEKKIVLPACHRELCSLQQFESFYKYLQDINFENMCNV